MVAFATPKRLLFVSTIALSHCLHASSNTIQPPSIPPKTFYNGSLQNADEMETADVYGCCKTDAECTDKQCTNIDTDALNEHWQLSRTPIGKMPQFTAQQSLQALSSARAAWNNGSGTWPQMSLSSRISVVESFLEELQKARSDIIQVLMWEIGKNHKDAAAEFDRTIEFCQKAINHIRTSGEFGVHSTHGSTKLYTSRGPVGIILVLGPYNYPLNETYAALIPALLMGNVVLLKIPTVGGLAHLLTMEAFKVFPEGTVNLVSGRGRSVMPPLMEGGEIDGLAFIGGSKAADQLIKSHPHPHRLKLFLQLEAKNMGIYMPDLFSENNIANEELIMKDTIAGTLSYNGQRCTALKLLLVPQQHAEKFAQTLSRRIEQMTVGLPWESSDGQYSQITPLPNMARVDYMQQLITDAVNKGAKIINKNGGKILGGPESTLMIPAVLYPVTSDMDIYQEEQFGPVVPITPYNSIDEVVTYAREGKYAQQVSIFTASLDETAALVDIFSTVFGKININSQCGRSPDTAPFSGRKSSALGVMSVSEALKEFSVPTVVSYRDEGVNRDVVSGVERVSNFMQQVV